jgi:hypothetical protein
MTPRPRARFLKQQGEAREGGVNDDRWSLVRATGCAFAPLLVALDVAQVGWGSACMVALSLCTPA